MFSWCGRFTIMKELGPLVRFTNVNNKAANYPMNFQGVLMVDTFIGSVGSPTKAVWQWLERASQVGWIVDWLDGWLFGFYVISTFVGYLTPNPFYASILFYFKQFSLAWVHSLIVKNIFTISYSVYSNTFNSANSVEYK